jgi:DNA replication and repair protein RecF
MHLTQLRLSGFRNYHQLEINIGTGLTVFAGENAQGKSNLLEAVYLLALTKSHRAENDREVVRFNGHDPVPYTRISGCATLGSGQELRVQVDMALLTQGLSASTNLPQNTLQKRIRVNGSPKKAIEAVGVLSAVLFCAEDIGLVYGSPAGRRRFLDVLLSQVSHGYLKSLQAYHKILAQRNHLLRRISDGSAGLEELPFWDEQLCSQGARIVWERSAVIDELTPLVSDTHSKIAQGGPLLTMGYGSSVERCDSLVRTADQLRTRLETYRARELRNRVTLVGPHRDDVHFLIDGRSVSRYGSRGQARTTVLSLRLGEARLIARMNQDEPILLLDDALAELDLGRQVRVLDLARVSNQVLLTAVDADHGIGLEGYATEWYWVNNGSLTKRSLDGIIPDNAISQL